MNILSLLKNNKKRSKSGVYADAAAATPLSPAVEAEMRRLLGMFGNAGALHQEGQAAKAVMDESREKVAQAIGAHSNEIIFTGSGTEANNLAIFGALKNLLYEHGELHAITTAIEHASVLEPLKALEADGLCVTVLPVDSEGLISIKDLKEAINEQTAFVSVQMVNSEIGTIQDIHEIAKEIRAVRKLRGVPFVRALRAARPSLTLTSRTSSELPILFHCDASQAPLWLDIKVEKLGIDLLTLDAQKILGPKGVGCLFAKRGVDLTPLIYGGGQEGGLRSGTENPLLIGAFAVALEEAVQHIDERAAKIAELRDYCFAEMQRLIPSSILNGPKSEHRIANNLNVSIPGLEAQMAVIALNVKGIAASTRSACDVGSDEPSEVIKAIGTPKELAGTAIRFTFLPSFTKAQAQQLARALYEVAKLYQNT